jgi:cell division protein ZapD
MPGTALWRVTPCLKHNRRMSEVQQQVAQPVMDTAEGITVYEQPLNERMRTFMRLDFLYNQALYQSEIATAASARAAMTGLLDILAITTRSDMRSDALKELERHLNHMNEFQSRPGVDAARLKTVIANLGRLRTDLLNAGSAFLQPIRDSEFLNSIKLRSAIPGGTCEFDLPEYFCWLNQPAESRMRAFGEWLGLLRPLCDAIAELLWLTRQAGRSRHEIAKGGVFMIGFDRDAPAQLLRIALPTEEGLYPEISGGGQHRCNVRFLKWNGLNARPAQIEEDVPFTLTICA